MELTQAQSDWLENIWSEERPIGVGEFLFRYVITPVDELIIASLMLWNFFYSADGVRGVLDVLFVIYAIYMGFGIVMCLINWAIFKLADAVPSIVPILDKQCLSRRNYERLVNGPPYLDIVRYAGFFFFITMLYIYTKPVYLLLTLIFWLAATITRQKFDQYAKKRLEQVNG